MPRRVVAEGDTLELGTHTLHFVMAPMVHWPEVMVEYEEKEKVLFSADGFGNFGGLTYTPDWGDEARRYYANIVGKYGVQVQGLLKKAAALEIASVCPLHGPQLSGDALAHALELYGHWAAWKPEEKGVLVAFASFHGHTAEAAGYMAKCLEELGEKVELIDLNRVHKSYAVSAAFRFDRMVLCANTYDGAYAPAMEAFLSILKIKGLQGAHGCAYGKRNVGADGSQAYARGDGRHEEHDDSRYAGDNSFCHERKEPHGNRTDGERNSRIISQT